MAPCGSLSNESNGRWLFMAFLLKHVFVPLHFSCVISKVSCVCRACYGGLRFVMENGAKGCEVCLKLYTVFSLYLDAWCLL